MFSRAGFNGIFGASFIALSLTSQDRKRKMIRGMDGRKQLRNKKKSAMPKRRKAWSMMASSREQGSMEYMVFPSWRCHQHRMCFVPWRREQIEEDLKVFTNQAGRVNHRPCRKFAFAFVCPS